MDEVEATGSKMVRATADEEEMSRYSIAQHQVNMPLTDFYE